MDKSLLNQILHEYELKRKKAYQEADERKRELIRVNPKLAELEKQISSNSIKVSKEILSSDDKTALINDLKKQNAKLIKEKNNFIKELTQTNNYLYPHFECKLCKDTGYVMRDGISTFCSCLKQRLYDVAYNKSNMGNLERENFQNFDLRIFSSSQNKDKFKSDSSPRENIQILREKAYSFIENFDNPDEKNLVFTGNTGTGKTFLTNCIASELLKKGKTVLYQTAPVMFDEIINEKFDKTESSFDIFENILNVDLLIIDDLGTEKISDTKITDLFTIINTRLLNQNHKITKTLISTNLTIDELFKTYTSRIGSRLAGNYRFLRFYGDDLRLRRGNKE